TESRAAWLTTAVGWLAGLLLLTREQRVKWLVYSGWTLVGAGAAYRIVFAAGLQGSHEGVGHMGETLGLLAILMASAAGFTALRTVFAGLSRRQLEIAAWAGLGAACLIMALLLPAVIQGRISSGHFQTAGARTMFYKDAWSLFLEAPLLGQGGDTWRMLFTQIQTYPYIGNEVHSGYLDLLLDLGIVGLLVFAFMMYGLLRIVWRHDRAGILPVGLLMVHAAVDFDMSFGYYWLLLFSWLVYYSPYPGAAQRGQSLFASPRSGQLPPRSVSLGK
ncbi:O-antigen ligase family protein, partial [Paenibacillus sepulcri]|nr:O-antigen ligase family protein [Paenibacillus sepulcri]